MIWSIAWRNIWRSKVRSFVILTAITLGIFAGVYSVAFMYGMLEQRIESMINTEISHIQLHNPEFLKTNEIKNHIPDINQVTTEIRQTEGVQSASARVLCNGMISSAETNQGVQLTGINPSQEKTVTNIHEKIIKGDYFKDNKGNRIVIGQVLADKLQVSLGSKIVLNLQELDGTLTGGAFRIAGIYSTNNSAYDEMNAFVRAEDLRNIITLNKNAGHEIAVLLNDNDDVKSISEKLTQQYPELEVRKWNEIMPEMELMAESMDYMMYILVGIILLALGFGIVNTMLMVIMERVKELGMLMAIGMNKFRVFSMIVLETVFICLLGGITGIALAALITWITHHTGIDLSLWSKGLNAYGFDAVVYPVIDLRTVIEVTILVIIVGILAALYPARKALKLKPAEALRIDN